MYAETLYSGSSGNLSLLVMPSAFAMLDCGVSRDKAIACRSYIIKTSPFMGCFVTHEHQDHARAAGDLAKAGIPVFMTKGTAKALSLTQSAFLTIIPTGKWFSVGDINVQAVPVEHDAADPVAFIFVDKFNMTQHLYMTDCADVPRVFLHTQPTTILAGVNWSAKELDNSDYSHVLKHRIANNHLSHSALMKFLHEVDCSGLERVICFHGSDTNLNKKKLESDLVNRLGKGVKVRVK